MKHFFEIVKLINKLSSKNLYTRRKISKMGWCHSIHFKYFDSIKNRYIGAKSCKFGPKLYDVEVYFLNNKLVITGQNIRVYKFVENNNLFIDADAVCIFDSNEFTKSDEFNLNLSTNMEISAAEIIALRDYIHKNKRLHNKKINVFYYGIDHIVGLV
ncbi:hypothetical protein XaC1_178 [Xanthomonas phage XaC1]|nr:hypothetical protein XaC1_178 [Xanthomonas phage XaC1]